MFDNIKPGDLCLVGAGHMAIEYAKVLMHNKIDFTVIGRGIESAKSFEEATGKTVITDGLSNYFLKTNYKPKFLIIAVQADLLYELSKIALNYEIPYILLEKPGALNISQLKKLQKLSSTKISKILIAYNRRFYDSVLLLKELIHEDGGLSNFYFDFTEITHKIDKIKKSKKILNHWIYANSSHVIDLAFFIGGAPKKIASFASNIQSWNDAPTIYSGAGITENNILFSYGSNWKSPGRWKLEFTTKKRKFLLQPLEELKLMNFGDFFYKDMELPRQKFKSGLEIMIDKFIKLNHSDFCDLNQQISTFKTIITMQIQNLLY